MKKTSSSINKSAEQSLSASAHPWAAIIGNPNSGKTAIFNNLTGANHKVGNYPGVTVEKKTGWLKGSAILLHDLPGTYSLSAKSMDEKVVVDTVQAWRNPACRPMAVIVVVDATNLSRNLFLTLQILEWGIPTIVVLNMMDEARRKGVHIDAEGLQAELHAFAVIPASAKTGEGMRLLIEKLKELKNHPHTRAVPVKLSIKPAWQEALQPLEQLLAGFRSRLFHNPLVDAIRLLPNAEYIDYLEPYLEDWEIEKLKLAVEECRKTCRERNIPYRTIESSARYNYIDTRLSDFFSTEVVEKRSLSERVDAVVSHSIGGPVILLLILGFIFNAIFSWAEYPMGWIEGAVAFTAQMLGEWLPAGIFKDLVINGIVAGVGNVIVFFPQIVLLIFFLSLLEDSGYMARMAFILDKLMSKIGLHGKSVLPMLSGFACAIPAIMASRTVENWRDRLVTIMLIPLMSCSARLPVYVLLISAFVPKQTVLGFIQLQGLVLMAMYFLGFFTAVIIALVVKNFVPERNVSHFIMELPPYRTPMLKSIWWKVYDSGKLFLTNAGSIILALSIVLWFLASYPRPAEEAHLTGKERVEQSYAGQLGRLVEPVIAPLGFDWKVGVGLIASFAAREVLVSTFATIYNIEEDNDKNLTPLITAMRNDRKADGTPVFTTLVALSLLVYFVYAAQCMATFAIVKRETNSWRWPIIMIVYMTTLAYLASLLVYQGGKLLGFA